MEISATIKKQSIPALILLVFLLLSTWGVMSAGYYYDELLHAVSAQKFIKGDHSYESDIPSVLKARLAEHTLPIMILYYVGPLKTYILIPIFYLFGDSLLTLRITTILTAGLTLLLTYSLVKKFISKETAIISAFLLAVDPSFILSSKYDWGPVMVQNILKVIFLYSFLVVWNGVKSKKWVAIMGLSSGLLIWDKLNGLWIIIPAISLIAYKIKQAKEYRLIPIFASSFLLSLTPFLLFVAKRPFFYTESQKSFSAFEKYSETLTNNNYLYTLLQNYSSYWISKLTTLFNTLDGTSIVNYMLETPQKTPRVFSLLFILSCIYIFTYLVKKKNISSINALGFITVGIIGFILITPHANGPHHMLLLYPLPHIFIGYTLANFAVSHSRKVITIIGILLLSNLVTLQQFNKSLGQNNTKVFWKRTNISQLEIKSVSRSIVALDWGISLPLAFTSHGEARVQDLQAFYENKCQQLKDLVVNKNYVAITFREKEQIFPLYYSQCKEYTEQLQKVTIDDYILYFN